MANAELELRIWQVVGWLIPIGMILLVVLVIRAVLRRPEVKFRHIYEDISLLAEPSPGSVFVSFRTYDGFLIWFTQTAHAGYAAPQVARELLRRLHRYNLIHGLFAYGALFVPIFSYFNYRAQLKSIAAQELTDSPVTR